MNISNMLKQLIFVTFVITITACSTQKNANNDDENSIDTNTALRTKILNSNNNISTDERAHLQIQKLQHSCIYFDLDKYNIRSEFTQVLDAHANFLCNNPHYQVTIEGHADERGTSEYNIALGERRANSVKNYLQGKGISADQITIISYGKEKPAVLGHDEEAYIKNRRAVLVY
ncbi:peptidoglycan-associated lipoprotein Pal [Candidatus Curculioniphilus buchneri]|uniref:peptidoglycan-associated lipoprotein Pal n=1 Tax=Candidatus Curculioniphilus buchneri TaxID=690594 RepID=UPI00376EDA2A